MTAGRCPHAFLPPLCLVCHKGLTPEEVAQAETELAGNRVLEEGRTSHKAKPKAPPKFDHDGRRRHAKFVDMVGERIGRLVVESEAERFNNGTVRWVCLCDCGERVTVTGLQLRAERRADRQTPYSCPACRPRRPGSVRRKGRP